MFHHKSDDHPTPVFMGREIKMRDICVSFSVSVCLSFHPEWFLRSIWNDFFKLVQWRSTMKDLNMNTRVNQVIYDKVGGWFCPSLWRQNNHKPFINTPDLHGMWALKLYSTHHHIFLCFCQFSEAFWPFLAILATSLPGVICAQMFFSLITAKWN